MFVQHRLRLEADALRDREQAFVAGQQRAFRRLEPSAQEHIGRRAVIVLAKQLEQPRRAKTRASHDRAGIGESRRLGTHLRHKPLDVFEHGIGAAREVVGMAFPARAQAGGAGRLAAREEAHVFRLRFARLACGQAVDAGGEYPGEKAAVARRVALQHAGIHRGMTHSHAANVADARGTVVRIIPAQFFSPADPHAGFSGTSTFPL